MSLACENPVSIGMNAAEKTERESLSRLFGENERSVSLASEGLP